MKTQEVTSLLKAILDKHNRRAEFAVPHVDIAAFHDLDTERCTDIVLVTFGSEEERRRNHGPGLEVEDAKRTTDSLTLC